MRGNEIGYFETLIREDHKFGENKYVLGVITGWADLIFEDCGHTAWITYDGSGGKRFGVICTYRDYDRFAHKVDENYSGLCVFDCKDTRGVSRFILM